MPSTAATLLAFRFATSRETMQRDPMSVTIEGSNLNGAALTSGSSWTLLYKGSSGLTYNPGRMRMGDAQILTESLTVFSSYRVLVTSTRGSSTSVSYSEVYLFFQDPYDELSELGISSG